MSGDMRFYMRIFENTLYRILKIAKRKPDIYCFSNRIFITKHFIRDLFRNHHAVGLVECGSGNTIFKIVGKDLEKSRVYIITVSLIKLTGLFIMLILQKHFVKRGKL